MEEENLLDLLFVYARSGFQIPVERRVKMLVVYEEPGGSIEEWVKNGTFGRRKTGDDEGAGAVAKPAQCNEEFSRDWLSTSWERQQMLRILCVTGIIANACTMLKVAERLLDESTQADTGALYAELMDAVVKVVFAVALFVFWHWKHLTSDRQKQHINSFFRAIVFPATIIFTGYTGRNQQLTEKLMADIVITGLFNTVFYSSWWLNCFTTCTVGFLVLEAQVQTRNLHDNLGLLLCVVATLMIHTFSAISYREHWCQQKLTKLKAM